MDEVGDARRRTSATADAASTGRGVRAGLPGEPTSTDDLVDETLRETFPASDPPSWWAGPPS
jgi:hypothetical protein